MSLVVRNDRIKNIINMNIDKLKLPNIKSRGKILQKNEQSLRDGWDNFTSSNIYVMVVP